MGIVSLNREGLVYSLLSLSLPMCMCVVVCVFKTTLSIAVAGDTV